jgi:NADH:ubiquinone oxidoreductase subunit H
MKLVVISILLSLFIFIGVLVSVAFLTLIERKLISATQNRKGPNTVGILGILQPFADALKLLAKETIFPRNARLFIFILSPLISLFFALTS